MRVRMGRKESIGVLLAIVVASSGWADSLFTQQVADGGTLISENINRFEVGDIITVLVRETIDATTESSTDTEKEADVEATASAAQNAFLVGQGSAGMNIFNPGELPNWKIEAENEYEGKGSTKRSNQLEMAVACTVTEVLDNGNLAISGTKRVTVNREDTILTVSGVVRPRDITLANIVLSTQLANASITLKGRGPLWNNQRRGLFTKILDWFSPF